MFTAVFIVHRPYFQHPETRDFWTQDMAYEWKSYPHPYTIIHGTSVTFVLKSYLIELNNVQLPATNIHHTSVGPSHTLEIIPKTQLVLQVPVQVLKESLSWNNVLITLTSYSKMLRIHGKIFSLFSILNIPITLSQAQTLLLHQPQKT